MDHKERALMTESKKALAVDICKHLPLIFFRYVCYLLGSTFLLWEQLVLVKVLLYRVLR
jgi:hypothetical protein